MTISRESIGNSNAIVILGSILVQTNDPMSIWLTPNAARALH